MTTPNRPDARAAGQRGSVANEVEGYLLLHAEREQARHEAETLCARLSWLTTAQAEDLTLHYTEQRLGLTRQALQVTADRAQRLRGEYEARYRALRHSLLRRHAVYACLLFTGAAATGTLAHMTAR
ncbi:hypothetical protein AB0F77_03315 [Streptomyces sp. NPDC026672]|uniref:hypothetical protein n=1 Tax=unclassified Streptomyces TaxID=2593676 RepID=UPI0033F20B54